MAFRMDYLHMLAKQDAEARLESKPSKEHPGKTSPIAGRVPQLGRDRGRD